MKLLSEGPSCSTGSLVRTASVVTQAIKSRG